MLTVATLLWDANENSLPFSRMYDESWVEKLYRGFARNLTVPFQFRCFTDRPRIWQEAAIKTSLLRNAGKPDYASCIEPFMLNQPMILVGLDTVILRNIDHLANYCLTSKMLALPRDPFHWSRACNGVCLVPGGWEQIYTTHAAGQNDMEWLRTFPHQFIDDIFPGSVKSYKGHVRGMTEHFKGVPQGFDGVDICYMHGVPKQHQMNTPDNEPIRRAWV
jgi:hypothetical protein